MAEDRGLTHYPGDDCPGGHKDEVAGGARPRLHQEQEAEAAINRALDDLERGYWPSTAASRALFRAVGRKPTKLSPERTGVVSALDFERIVAQVERLRAELNALRRENEALRAKLRAAVEMKKGCGSAMWVIQNRHNKNLPEWEGYAAAAERDIRAALAAWRAAGEESDMIQGEDR